jgi:hypothetical protein
MTKKSFFSLLFAFATSMSLNLASAQTSPAVVVKGVSKKCVPKLLEKTLIYSALSETDFAQLPLKTIKALKAPFPESLVGQQSAFFDYALTKIQNNSRKKIVAVSYFFNESTSVINYYIVKPTLFGCKIDPVTVHQHFY